MSCYRPIQAYQSPHGGRLIFSDRGDVRPITIPCGYCVGCRTARARAWAIRCMHESSLYVYNSFVTLTYDDVHLPDSGSLVYRDFQLFMKRLRKLKGPVRFFMCGEYGSRTLRPHYHALLFGVQFENMIELFKTPAGHSVYISDELSSVWKLGHCSIGSVTVASAMYIAKYCITKKPVDSPAYNRVDLDTGEVTRVIPELSHMSLGRTKGDGIGARWFHKYRADVFPHDYVVVDGVKRPVPKYYKALLTDLDPMENVDVDARRFEFFSDPTRVLDSSDERLAVRECVATAAINFRRNLE